MVEIALFQQYPRRHYDLIQYELTGKEKEWIAKRIISGEKNVKELVRQYNLNKETILSWCKRINKGFNLRGKGGRPMLISPKKQEKLIDALSNKKYQTPKNVFKNLVNDIIVEQATERGNSISSTTAASTRTFKRYEKALHINSGNAEQTTNARMKATESVKNAVSFIAMNSLMLESTDDDDLICSKSMLNLNVDATQFAVGYKGDQAVEVKYIGDEVKKNTSNDALKCEPVKGDNQIGLFTIKYYALVNAFGKTGKPIFVIAHDDMDEDDIDVYEVPGLSIGTEISATGYVVFCKTRFCNDAFYTWLVKKHLVPWVQEIKETFHLPINSVT